MRIHTLLLASTILLLAVFGATPSVAAHAARTAHPLTPSCSGTLTYHRYADTGRIDIDGVTFEAWLNVETSPDNGAWACSISASAKFWADSGSVTLRPAVAELCASRSGRLCSNVVYTVSANPLTITTSGTQLNTNLNEVGTTGGKCATSYTWSSFGGWGPSGGVQWGQGANWCPAL